MQKVQGSLVVFVGLSLILITVPDKQICAQIVERQDKKTLMKADDAFYYGDFLTAMKLYQSLYPLDSSGAELNYKLGICNYELKESRSTSKKYFEKVPPSKFPEVSFYLGKLNHLNNDFEKAIFYFNQYKAAKGEKEHSEKEINDLIGKCNTAVLFESQENKTIEIINIGRAINTEYAEYAPLIPADENFILFTSRRKNEIYPETDPLGKYFEDIYISNKNSDGGWGQPVLLDTNINTSLHDASTGISADGEKMFMYRTGKDLISGDIYESRFVNGKWDDPKILGPNVNSKYLETSACYSDQGDVIYFSSNRPGGYGGKDLYRARKLPNGNWGAPYNLGPTINTEYNEDSPFIHPMGNALYFSSEGHKNMGGFDIFKTDFDGNVTFSTPENLGYPINTVDDDIFFVMNTEGSKGYLSSGRKGGFGSQDIYAVNLKKKVVPVNVYNIYVKDSTSVIKTVDVQIIDFAKNKIIGFYKANENSGKVLVISEPDREFQIIIKAVGYAPFMDKIVFGTEKEINYQVSEKLHD